MLWPISNSETAWLQTSSTFVSPAPKKASSTCGPAGRRLFKERLTLRQAIGGALTACGVMVTALG